MLKFIETLKNIWTIDELKNRIFLTLFFLIIYRLAAQVVLPGVDYNIIADAQIAGGGGLLGLLNAFTGGAFANASVVALGIMPYISASIVVQLMGVALPYLQKLQKEGESGRKKNYSNYTLVDYCNMCCTSPSILIWFGSLRCS